MNVLIIGKPKYDVILSVDNYLVENSKTDISEKKEITGGISAYVACMLAKWGINVYYAGAICADEVGNKIKSELESYGVDTRFMETDYEHKSNINYCLLNKANGSFTEVHVTNDVYLKKYKYDLNIDYIITDGSDMGASIAAANNYPMAKIILLANKVNDEYYNLSKRCAYVCASTNFAKALTKLDLEFNKPKSLVNFFQKIKDLNKAEYIVMLRDKGVLYNKDRQVKMIPALKIDIKDDSNSSAAFFASYCFGIINGLDKDIVAKTSNIAGALALTKAYSLETIPNKEEVFKLAGIEENSLPKEEVKTEVLDNKEVVEHPQAVPTESLEDLSNDLPMPKLVSEEKIEGLSDENNG